MVPPLSLPTQRPASMRRQRHDATNTMPTSNSSRGSVRPTITQEQAMINMPFASEQKSVRDQSVYSLMDLQNLFNESTAFGSFIHLLLLATQQLATHNTQKIAVAAMDVKSIPTQWRPSLNFLHFLLAVSGYFHQ